MGPRPDGRISAVTTTPSADPGSARPRSAARAQGSADDGPRRAGDEPTATDQPRVVGREPRDGTQQPGKARTVSAGGATDVSSSSTGGSGAPVTEAAADDVGRSRDGTEPVATVPNRRLGYRRQRFEARKVRRLIRHVDPWSMLKLAVLVSLCMWLIVMIAALVLWTVARNAGTISNVESFVNSSLSLKDWRLDGEFIFRQFGLITLLLALGFAAAVVVASLVFNLISDIIGGVWVSVIEEETARPVAESKPD